MFTLAEQESPQRKIIGFRGNMFCGCCYLIHEDIDYARLPTTTKTLSCHLSHAYEFYHSCKQTLRMGKRFLELMQVQF